MASLTKYFAFSPRPNFFRLKGSIHIMKYMQNRKSAVHKLSRRVPVSADINRYTVFQRQ